ncbi:MAG: hypothetical protein CL608_21545 [Anaerolineaceae bacterium]|nr:hypothetical protein [Anaerolineaceae bacterium]
MHDNDSLAIILFGEFSLIPVNKTAVNFSGDRPISLLAYLLLHRNTTVSRQHLAFTLWPDSSDTQARANLRNLLYTLRQTLPNADTFLLADSLTLQWRSDAPFSLDVAEFEAALAATETAVSPTDKIAHLGTAVSLYTGDLLLGNYDDWIIPLREELRQSYLDALRQLVLLLEQQPDYRAAARYGQRLLQQDPLDETAYVQLMRLHALSGDRAGVRRVYDTCVTTLRRELDVEPAPTTQAAYEQLIRLEAPATAVVTATPTPVVAANQPVENPPAPSRPRPLPLPPTPFIGREAELAHLAEMLSDPACRLLTIVGPGGIGKTRLALQTAVGHQPVFPHGVAFIDLAPIHNVDLMATTMAQALDMTLSNLSAHQAQLVDYVQDKQQLLVLDNMEHLLDGAEILIDILAGAPKVKILVTSRQRLELAEEWVFDLLGLPLPDAETPLAENSAVALFLQTARRINHNFILTDAEETAVIRICQLVAGMPLGLQLAATWVRVLSCTEIAQEIERDIDFLSSSQRHLPERQRSMRAVFDYSWQLLTPEEREASGRLAIFQGGFSREAAEAVAEATLPILSALVDKALVNRMGNGRYQLHELVRQYILQKQADTAADKAAHEAHATYYQSLAETARIQLQGPEGMAWLAKLDAEIDNLRSALAWTVENQMVESGMRLGGGLWRYWWWRGHWREGLGWLEKLFVQLNEVTPATLPASVQAVAYQGAGVLARSLGNYGQARIYYQQSLALQEQDGNSSGVAAALNSLGTLAMFEADYAEAERRFSQSKQLNEASGNKRGRENAINNLAIVAMYRGDFQQALAFHQENLSLARERGNAAHIAAALGNLGDVYRYLQAYDKAQAVLDESLALLRQVNNKSALATTLYSLARLTIDTNEFEAAARYFRECLLIYRETQDPVAIADAIEGTAILAGKQDYPLQCAELFGAAAAIRQKTGTAVPHSERATHNLIQANAAEAIGEAHYQDAWQHGQKMTLPESLTAALKSLDCL